MSVSPPRYARFNRELLLPALAVGLVVSLVSVGSGSEGAAASPPKPMTIVTGPVANSTYTPTNRPEVRLTGTASATPVATTIRVAIQNVATGEWRQSDGSFARRWDAQDAAGTTQWHLDAVLPEGRFAVRARAMRSTGPDSAAVVAFNVAGRDPLLWPYPSDSFWNTPRGAGAALIDFNMTAPTQKTLNAEDDLLFLDPNMPTGRWSAIAPHSGGWKQVNGSHQRCQTAARGASVSLGNNASFPMRDLSPGQEHGATPNNSTAIVMPDYTLRETQPLTQCAGGFASQYGSPKWQGDSLLTGGMGPNADNTSGGGAHGGAFMTAFGGTIRLGEWTRGGNIPHATKIEIFAQKWLTQNTGRFQGHRWPALAADSGWNGANGYGTQAPSTRSQHAVMGALLTLPNNFNVNALKSEPAQILARSIRDYGTYIVDNTGWDAVQFSTEWSPEGRVVDEFKTQFGFTLDGKRSAAASPKNTFLADMETIYSSLHIVADNNRRTTGGTGSRMTFTAPALG